MNRAQFGATVQTWLLSCALVRVPERSRPILYFTTSFTMQIESQVLIAKLSEQDNPYGIIASWVSAWLRQIGGVVCCELQGFVVFFC